MVLDHNRYPITTLFMLMSIDGKISTGEGPTYDVDADFPKISGVKEGLPEYYRIQGETDWWCLVTGTTMAKIGANSGKLQMPNVKGLHRVILGAGDLTEKGIECLISQSDNIHFIVQNTSDLNKVYRGIINYKDSSNWTAVAFGKESFSGRRLSYYNPLDILYYLKTIGCDELTVQSGGTVNGAFVNAHALDKLHLVMAPCLIGGATTPTLIDGTPRTKGLSHINTFKLINAKPLPGSYLELEYEAF